MKQLKPDEIIATKAASNIRGIESLLHKRYKEKRIPQSEYFRLSPQEVSEAATLLGCKGTIQELSDKSLAKEEAEIEALEASWIPKTRFSEQTIEVLELLESVLFNTLSTEILYAEGYDSFTNIRGSHIEIIMSTDNNDPDISIPVSNQLREACSRRLSREDLFSEIATSQDDSDALQLARCLKLDFYLIYCWGYRQGMFVFRPSSGEQSDIDSLIESMEQELRSNNVWYTLKTDLKPLTEKRNSVNIFWLFVGMACIGSFVLPPIGIPTLCLLFVFKNKITRWLNGD
jgi:hypothetical protein